MTASAPDLNDDLAGELGQRYQSWPGIPDQGFPLGRLLLLAPFLLAFAAVAIGLPVWAFLALAT